MNGLLHCMYARCFIQDAGNIYIYKKKKQVKGVSYDGAMMADATHTAFFFFELCFMFFFCFLIVQRYCFSFSALDDNDEQKEQKRNEKYVFMFL
jgi:hypothetical protein